jgi:hypothetical protein
VLVPVADEPLKALALLLRTQGSRRSSGIFARSAD